MSNVGSMSDYISLYSEEKKFIGRVELPSDTELEELLEEMLGKGKSSNNLTTRDLHQLNEMFIKEFNIDATTFKEISKEMLYDSPKLYLWEFVLNLIVI